MAKRKPLDQLSYTRFHDVLFAEKGRPWDHKCVDCDGQGEEWLKWGDDPSKWVIYKSDFTDGWIVFPPHNGEAFMVPAFPFPQAQGMKT